MFFKVLAVFTVLHVRIYNQYRGRILVDLDLSYPCTTSLHKVSRGTWLVVQILVIFPRSRLSMLFLLVSCRYIVRFRNCRNYVRLLHLQCCIWTCVAGGTCVSHVFRKV